MERNDHTSNNVPVVTVAVLVRARLFKDLFEWTFVSSRAKCHDNKYLISFKCNILSLVLPENLPCIEYIIV